MSIHEFISNKIYIFTKTIFTIKVYFLNIIYIEARIKICFIQTFKHSHY